jgi:peroxiredoxin
MNPNLVVGGTFPDIELPDGDGVLYRLSAVQGNGPLAVIFYRGWF